MEALRKEYFEFAIENRLDYVPLFEEGETPTQSQEYLYYAFILNLDNWGDDKGLMTKDYVEQVIQTHFEVDSVSMDLWREVGITMAKIYCSSSRCK